MHILIVLCVVFAYGTCLYYMQSGRYLDALKRLKQQHQDLKGQLSYALQYNEKVVAALHQSETDNIHAQATIKNLMAEVSFLRGKPAPKGDKTEWRKLVQMSHPDKATDLATAKAMLNEICRLAVLMR